MYCCAGSVHGLAGLQSGRAVPANALHSEGPALLHAGPGRKLSDWAVPHHARLCHARAGRPAQYQLHSAAHAGAFHSSPLHLQRIPCTSESMPLPGWELALGMQRQRETFLRGQFMQISLM